MVYNIRVGSRKMGKKTVKKQQVKEQEDALGQEEEEEESARSGEQREGGRGRQDNSLSVLTKKFIDLIKGSDNATIDLNLAV